jgi:hypothetical protein
MALKLRNTQRIGDVKALAIISVAVICDALKILLFFINAIPLVGTALDAIVSFFVSIIEVIIDFGTLGFSGAYTGPGSTTNLLFTMAATVIDFVPIIDDLPITTLSVLFIIWNSRKTDKKQNDAAAKVAASTKHTNQVQYEIRERAAQNAVANANAMRQQAMDVSRSKITPPPQAANDVYPTAANFSTDEEFPEAA